MADGVILSEDLCRRLMAVIKWAESQMAAGGGGPSGDRRPGQPGQFPPCRWAKITSRTAGPPVSYEWTEVVRDAAGTWKVKAAADGGKTSAARTANPAGFGPAYEINAIDFADPVNKFIYLFPVWTGETFEYRYFAPAPDIPAATERYDVLVANDTDLKWKPGRVRAH